MRRQTCLEVTSAKHSKPSQTYPDSRENKVVGLRNGGSSCVTTDDNSSAASRGTAKLISQPDYIRFSRGVRGSIKFSQQRTDPAFSQELESCACL